MKPTAPSFVVVLGLALLGCGEEGDLRCMEGATVSCICVSGASGIQTCLEGGRRLSTCICSASVGDAAVIDSEEPSASDSAAFDLPPVQDTVYDPSDAEVAESEDIDASPDDLVSGPDSQTGACPSAEILVVEGGEVLPRTTLNLSAVNLVGDVTRFEWSVSQPDGATSFFRPDDRAANVSFDVNNVGTYLFNLEVADSQGRPGCSAAEYAVFVVTEDAVYLELTWDSPGDPVQTDVAVAEGKTSPSVGTDLDLHLLQPKAAGRWFDPIYDCHWNNTWPEWGVSGPADNPKYAIDDRDGSGPESISLGVPEQGVRYQLGVHYWHDWGFGSSVATIRIYIYNVLKDSWSAELRNGDMWTSHHIDWPSASVRRVGEEPHIIGNFQSEFPQ